MLERRRNLDRATACLHGLAVELGRIARIAAARRLVGDRGERQRRWRARRIVEEPEVQCLVLEHDPLRNGIARLARHLCQRADLEHLHSLRQMVHRQPVLIGGQKDDAVDLVLDDVIEQQLPLVAKSHPVVDPRRSPRERYARDDELERRGALAERLEEPRALRLPEHRLLLGVGGEVRGPVTPQIEQEDVDVRPPRMVSIDLAISVVRSRHGKELVPRLQRGAHPLGLTLLDPGIPVVDDLVIIPDRVHAHRSREHANRRMIARGDVLGAELVERMGVAAGVGVWPVSEREVEVRVAQGELVEEAVVLVAVCDVGRERDPDGAVGQRGCREPSRRCTLWGAGPVVDLDHVAVERPGEEPFDVDLGAEPAGLRRRDPVGRRRLTLWTRRELDPDVGRAARQGPDGGAIVADACRHRAGRKQRPRPRTLLELGATRLRGPALTRRTRRWHGVRRCRGGGLVGPQGRLGTPFPGCFGAIVGRLRPVGLFVRDR